MVGPPADNGEIRLENDTLRTHHVRTDKLDLIERFKIERLAFGAGIGKKYHKVAGSPGAGYENTGERAAPALEQLLKKGF